VVEGAALEKQYAGQLVSWVQIPPSPPRKGLVGVQGFFVVSGGFDRGVPVAFPGPKAQKMPWRACFGLACKAKSNPTLSARLFYPVF
jgi:hypothetical protein